MKLYKTIFKHDPSKVGPEAYEVLNIWEETADVVAAFDRIEANIRAGILPASIQTYSDKQSG